MSLWLVMFTAGVVTFATRLSFIYLFGRMHVPDWFQRSLRFVPAAVLSAIILPGLVGWQGGVNYSLRNPQLIAGALAILVAWRTKNVLLTIVSGMTAMLILRAFLT